MKQQSWNIILGILIIFLVGVIIGIILTESFTSSFTSYPTSSDIAAIADSIAQAKIDSLFPLWIHDIQDWSVLHRQVQFHAMLHRRFYSGKSKWHRYVRRELDEANEYWQPKNKEKP